MRSFVIAALAALVSLSVSGSDGARAQARVGVVASILPVHSLVAGVMEGAGRPYLLVPGGASPHSFALRPSDARQLEQAQAVFWIGPTLETFLERPLDALAQKADVVALSGAEGVRRLPFREGGPWEAHSHGAEDKDAHHDGEEREHDHDHDHDHGHGDHDHGMDAHVWLDPLNAIAFVKTIAHVLGHIDPAGTALYEANAERLVAKLKALDSDLRQMLAPVQGKPYIVFHDGYQYFEARYGLTPSGSVTVSPELSPGAKRLVGIRSRIKEEAAICVFAEPQFEPKLVRTVIERTGARTATLDPLGAALEPGPDAYFQLMRNLAKDLAACLE